MSVKTLSVETGLADDIAEAASEGLSVAGLSSMRRRAYRFGARFPCGPYFSARSAATPANIAADAALPPALTRRQPALGDSPAKQKARPRLSALLMAGRLRSG